MNLSEKLKQEQEDLSKRLKLLKKFPNLQEVGLRWSTVLASIDINSMVDKVQFNRSCGCCPDPVVYAKPYLEVDGIRIYSFPVQFSIGENYDWHFGEEYETWKEKMKESGISSKCIELTEEYIRKEKEETEEYLRNKKEDDEY